MTFARYTRLMAINDKYSLNDPNALNASDTLLSQLADYQGNTPPYYVGGGHLA